MPRKRRVIPESDKPALRKAQMIFRLWTDDRAKLIRKMKKDNTGTQRLVETLVKEYLDGNPAIEQIVRTKAARHDGPGGKYMKRSRGWFDEYDTDTILKKIQVVSPLQDNNPIRLGDEDDDE
jgi:hypothetical protein